MDGQVIRGINFYAYDSRVKIAAQEESRRWEHFGDITVQVVILVVKQESENILLGKMVKYVSKLSF